MAIIFPIKKRTPVPILSRGGKLTTAVYRGQRATYAVTYGDGGLPLGAPPVDSGQYAEGATVTVLGNTGSLAIPGFSFLGWGR